MTGELSDEILGSKDDWTLKTGASGVRVRKCYPVQSHLATMGNTLSVENIVKEVRAEIGRLQQVLALLGAETGHGVSVRKTAAVEKPKRKVSAAARRKMAAAQKARWARIKAAKK
jgi:hypothetical protein